MKDHLTLSDYKIETKRQKGKSLISFQHVYPFFKKHFKLVVISSLFFFTVVGINLSIPKYLGKFIDALFQDVSTFSFYFPLFCLLFMAKIIFDISYKFSLLKLGENILFDMRNQMMEILSYLPMRFFDINSSGRIISRTVNDITNISMIFSSHIYHTVGEVITIFGSLIVLLILFPPIGAILITLIIFLFFVLYHAAQIMGVKMRKTRSLSSRTNTYVADALGGMELVLSQGLKPLWMRNFSRLNRLYYLSTYKLCMVWTWFPSVHACVMGLTYAFIVYWAGSRLSSGELSRGEFLSLLFYVSMTFQPLHELSGKISDLQMGLSSLGKVGEILKLKNFLEEKDERDTPHVNFHLKDIHFDHFNFSYDGINQIFHNLNLTLEGGKITAILGRTGSGKTSLVNILCKLYPSYQGEILIGETPLKEISRKKLSQHVGIVTQQLFIFEDTIRENLRLYNDEITDEQIWNVLNEINLSEKIKLLPNSLDTFFTKDSDSFSQGEKQLLVIARMLLKNPDILIFDEATASLDNESEFIVQKALNKLFKGRTTLIIAHRLSTIQLAEEIIVLDHGQIIEKGQPDILMAQDGAYASYIKLLEEGHQL